MVMANRSGLGHAPAYQVSGYPWVTGSTIPNGTGYVKVSFPNVSKQFTVVNKDASAIWPTSLAGSASIVVFFGPEPTGAFPYPQITQNHYFTIPGGDDGFTFNVKCSEFFVAKLDTTHTGAFQIIAELTSISPFDMPPLTGSGIDI